MTIIYHIKQRILTLLALLLVGTSNAQTTNINGVINAYSEVTAISYVNNSVTVTTPGNYNAGEKVLLIQMNGATIDETNTSSFGTITNYNDAGNYEFAIICEINGSEIIFVNTLLRTYDPVNAAVQLVTVPIYVGDVSLTSTVIPSAWDGTTGGVIAMEVTDTLHMNAGHINVRRLGFRGYNAVLSGNGCSNSGDLSYFTAFSSADAKALKGEGIAAAISNKECSRGAQANGGGGGNNHNGGGSGGGNYGAGGLGGRRIPRSAFTCESPVGTNAKALTYDNTFNRVFMGGGGGAGHANNLLQTAMNGQAGGGIIFVKAAVVDGNSRTFFAFGGGLNGASDEGGGGSGAGGTVVLDVAEFITTTNVVADGRWGYNTNNVGTSNCNGPGGGGGGGVAWFSLGSTPGTVSTTVTGGAAGTTLTTSQTNCTVGSTNGATAGAVGTVLHNYVPPQSTTPFAGCTILGMELIAFDGEQKEEVVELTWSTASETDNSHFEIQRSNDLESIESVETVKGAGNSSHILSYQAYDTNPAKGGAYYRLKQVDYDGTSTYTGWKFIAFTGKNELLNIFPNPTQSSDLHVVFFLNSSDRVVLSLSDVSGNEVLSQTSEYQTGQQEALLDVSNLKDGLYVLTVQMGRNYFERKKVIVSQ